MAKCEQCGAKITFLEIVKYGNNPLCHACYADRLEKQRIIEQQVITETKIVPSDDEPVSPSEMRAFFGNIKQTNREQIEETKKAVLYLRIGVILFGLVFFVIPGCKSLLENH